MGGRADSSGYFSGRPKHPVLLPGSLSFDQQCVAVLSDAASIFRVPGKRVVAESAAVGRCYRVRARRSIAPEMQHRSYAVMPSSVLATNVFGASRRPGGGLLDEMGHRIPPPRSNNGDVGTLSGYLWCQHLF